MKRRMEWEARQRIEVLEGRIAAIREAASFLGVEGKPRQPDRFTIHQEVNLGRI